MTGPSIGTMRENLLKARSAWEEQAVAIRDARERTWDALVLVAESGQGNQQAAMLTRVAFSYRGGMGGGGEIAVGLADQMRARISNQATALRSVVAELDKLVPTVESEIDTINRMLAVLSS